MKIYNILLRVTFLLALYLWVYDSFLYEITYVQYLPNYKEEVAFPTYSPDDLDNGETYNKFENMPIWSRVMYDFWSIGLLSLYLMVVISFMVGLFLLFKKRKILNFKWYVTQILLYGGIVWFIANTPPLD